MKIKDFGGKFQEVKTTPELSGKKLSNGKNENPSKPPETFRINQEIKELTKPKTPQDRSSDKDETQQQSIGTSEPFDVTKVTAVLNKYLQHHHPELSVEIALKTHKPLIEEGKITLLVDNKLQLERLEAIKMQLHTFFMKNLNHGSLLLEFQLFDTTKTQEKKKFFTSGEKFEHFVELNPAVADLKKIFGLELE